MATHPNTFSIDIKVLTDLKRYRAEKTVLAMVGAFFCLKQDGQDFQDGQDRAAQERGVKVWKTLMSIARRRNKA